MDFVVKSFFALCLGVLVIAGVQKFYVSAMTDMVRSDSGKQAGVPEFKSPFATDGVKLAPLITTMKPLDTREYERLGVEGAARRVDQQVRGAQSAVPIQRSIPGFSR